MSNSLKQQDAKLAWQIHNQMNRFDVTGITENAAFPNSSSKENYKPKTLIDNTLEIIDPTPNIHTLFVQFDKRFFSNKLISVEVKWSPRMTSCAGTCSFNTGSRYCVIALSCPLLKLRPRKDLVETLLHEMIHAYLFVTNNNRDRDGHGPEFCKHMNRINKDAGTNITVYHSFHAEVKLYQQHWWRCNGPCQKKHPFFGMVRRAMNRAPGPNDFWWKEHQLTCRGQFIKVREPEKAATKGKKTKNDSKKSSIDKWLIPSPDNKPKGKFGSSDFAKPKDKTGSVFGKKTGTNNPFKSGGVGLKTKGGSSVLTVNKWNTNANSNEPEITKLGNTTNNVHGFGTGGSDSCNSSSSSKNATASGKHVSFSGTLGGSATGQSRLLQIFSSTKTPQSSCESNEKKEFKNKNSQDFGPTVKCPICKDLILEKIANEHIDTCLLHKEKKKKTPFVNSTPRFTPGESNKEKLKNGKDTAKCPVCSKPISLSLMTNHIDECLASNDDNHSPASEKFYSPMSFQSPKSSPIVENSMKTILIHDSSSEFDTPTKKRKITDFFNSKEPKTPKNDDRNANCPVCKKEIKIQDMNRHLDDCLTAVNDEMDTNEAGPSSKVDKNKEDEIERGNELGSKPETCLICNEILDPEIPLTQHLDDCLRNMFNDDSDESFESSPLQEVKVNEESKSTISMESTEIIEIDDSPVKEKNELVDKEKINRFPCPICMSLIPQNKMNDHLDSCMG